MTDKQIDRVKLKINKYKKLLALDKKHWGGFYHDGQGIRYLIPQLYIQIKDYKGGQKYFNWFDKNFPNDSCYPIFLFEYAFVLYKCGKISEAEKKIHSTFFSNTYLLDKFLEKEFLELGKDESSSWELQSVTAHFHYNKNDEEFIDFANWTTQQLQTRKFLDKANRFVEIEQQLKTEPVGQKRTKLVNELSKLRYD
ncbi:MAG: hypothetical protein SGJ10_02450 [Bacteroidota bacterium]|nr:hypothetical protein [Bacteroidota bacterium]